MTDSTFTIQQNTVNGLVSALDGKASVDLSNSPYTTNRILEIPQDIKLELSNGTLTLKAGSKVYVPNGFEQDGTTPKFDVVTTTEDVIQANVSSTARLMFLKNSTAFGPSLPVSNCFSGNTSPTHTGYAYWYDTANNIIRYDGNTGTWDAGGYSLPVGIRTANNSVVTSIDQVFNGFGYIGSTVFALPGVKVQTPNGRNEDGTYITLERIVDTVKIMQAGDWGTRNLNIQISGSFASPYFEAQAVERFTYNKKFSSDTYTYSYDENTGVWWYSTDQSSWVKIPNNIVGFCRVESGKITQFQIGTVDSVANSNASNFSQAGRNTLIGWGMPDYSAGVALSPSTLTTITTKGWINYTSIRTNAIGGVTVSNVLFQSGSSATNDRGSMMIPVDVGDTVQGVSGGSDTVTFYPCKGV